MGLCILVTPGTYRSFDPASKSGPTVVMHTYRLPFQLSAEIYKQGQSLITTDIQQVPHECWPPQLKCRSRMHYYLADQQAQARQSGARAVLLDADGIVTEASTANIVAYRAGEGFVSPPLENILHGISLEVLAELASALGESITYRDLAQQELASADEILLTSTTTCVLPVVELDGKKIGDGRPGAMFHRLLRAWSELVGLDVAAQANRFGSE